MLVQTIDIMVRRKFAAVTIRLTRPTTTILLFTSGKLVITGSKSASESLLAAYHVSRLLKRVCVGQQFRCIAFNIQNVVGAALVVCLCVLVFAR